MKIFKNIKSVWPETADEVSDLFPKILEHNRPWYVNLKR
jgi:hypothetical protein